MSGRLSGIKRIAVLRANGLGDLMFALPALDALRAAYPNATITLLGKPWHAEFLRGRPGPVDEVFVLPDIPGITIDEKAEADPAAAEQALAALRERRFDLALQMFGGGRYSNPFVLSLEARHTAGLQADDAGPLDLTVPYRYFQPEVFRLLEVAGLVGAKPVALTPRLWRTKADEMEAETVLAEADVGQTATRRNRPRRLVAIHPVAGDGRRCWPAEYFGWVARRLAERGAAVFVLGSAADRPVTAAVTAAADGLATDLGGRLTLGGLAGVLARATAVVANDSGPLHLAQAVGAATVGIFWCGNLINAGPLGRLRHRAVISWRLECPVCGANCITSYCDHHVSFVADVPPREVLGEALSLLKADSVGKWY